MRFYTLAAFFLMAFPASASDPCPKLKPGTFPENFFHPCRPEPIGAFEKEQVLRSLPAAGEVTAFSRSEQKKLSAIDAVLRLHERSTVYTVKVVDIGPATTALHGRAVVLITHPALAVLSTEELQALIAHEVGHEYVWQQFAAARRRGDTARLRELELICDTIAAETLRRLNVPPERLFTALIRIAAYNQERFGEILNTDDYPELSARKSAITLWRSSSTKP